MSESFSYHLTYPASLVILSVCERKEAPLALRAARPHTVGYTGGCNQEEGEIECPCREQLGALSDQEAYLQVQSFN